MLGHHRPANETPFKSPFKWRFVGVPMMARLYRYFYPPYPHQLNKIKYKRFQSWTLYDKKVTDPRMVIHFYEP